MTAQTVLMKIQKCAVSILQQQQVDYVCAFSAVIASHLYVICIHIFLYSVHSVSCSVFFFICQSALLQQKPRPTYQFNHILYSYSFLILEIVHYLSVCLIFYPNVQFCYAVFISIQYWTFVCISLSLLPCV